MEQLAPSYRGGRPFVFVSYSHLDEELVYREIHWLQDRGVNVWYDSRIRGGSEWSNAIADAIVRCSLFLYFVTPNSVESENCRRELNYALEEGSQILAIHLRETAVPGGIRLNLNNRQAIHRYRLSDDDYARALADAMELSDSQTTTTAATDSLAGTTRRAAFVGLALILVGAGLFFGLGQITAARDRADRAENITALLKEGQTVDAFALAVTSSDPELHIPLLGDSVTDGSIRASEPGAQASIKAYAAPSSDWIPVGVTPIEDTPLPRGPLRVRIEAPGFETVEFAALNPGPYFDNFEMPIPAVYEIPFTVPLMPEGTVPQGMVRIPDTTLDVPMFAGPTESIPLQSYFIDTLEVTNAEFNEFVDAGGYQNAEYWLDMPQTGTEERFSWPDTVSSLVDSTGRAGPSTWELGAYPTGTGEEPVTGVSWYEAVAYSRFAGKSLPTAAQWVRAAYAMSMFSPAWQNSVAAANFENDVPLPVGASGSLGPFGTYDMPGNAREWVWNEQGGSRLTVGGGYTEPAKLFSVPQRRPPLDRSAENGFRLVVNPEPLPTESLAALPWEFRDPATARPVSDDAFHGLLAAFTYVPGDPEPDVLTIEEHSEFLKEIVEINTGYGERIRLYIYRPDETGPFESVVFMGGGADFLYLHASEGAVADGESEIVPLVASGRAFIRPVWFGSFERYDGASERGSKEAWEAVQVQRMTRWRQEFGRIIDYLDQRPDFDADAIAYMGLSFGGMFGINLLAIETRVKAGIVVSGGVWPREFHPLYDPLNYYPRITQPMLMLTGENDFVVPPDTVQIPSFELLTAEHKRQVIFPATGHWPFPRTQYLTEVGDWLDTYL